MIPRATTATAAAAARRGLRRWWRRRTTTSSSGGSSNGGRGGGSSLLWKVVGFWMFVPGSSLLPLWLLSLLLGRGGSGGGDWAPRQLVLGGSGSQGQQQQQQQQQQHDPCLQEAGAWTVWEDWRVCRLNQSQGLVDADGDDWLVDAPQHWEDFEAAAVLVELEGADDARPRPLRFAIRNALENLPVPWRIQVVAGSDAVEAAVLQLFPVEMDVGKVVVTRAAEGALEGKARLNQLLTDPAFYDTLLGDVWLFFQLDSAICSPQRHLLRGFVEGRPRGWYGAPWPHRAQLLQGGNGGFSLRRREFVAMILERFPRKDAAQPEDAYFIEAAASIREELPLQLRPAEYTEEVAFAVESVFAPTAPPFGVHQFWTKAKTAMQDVEGLLQSCPEALVILPPQVVRDSAEWGEMVCGGGKWESEGGVRQVSKAWTEEDVCDGWVGAAAGGGGAGGGGTDR